MNPEAFCQTINDAFGDDVHAEIDGGINGTRIIRLRIDNRYVRMTESGGMLDKGTVEKENPWLKFAGIFKDDPDFERVMWHIEENRKEWDGGY